MPAVFWLSIAVAVLFWCSLRLTGVGGGLSAVGHDARAAIRSGRPVRRLMVTACGLSGLLAGPAGILVMAVGGAASPCRFGSDRIEHLTL